MKYETHARHLLMAGLNPLPTAMKPIPFSLLLLAVLTISVSAKEPLPPQTDWAQWRGPAFNGTAPGATPPATWSESQNVKWKFKIPGFGSSSPIVWKNQVFILTAIPSGKKIETPAAPEPPEENQPGGRRRSEKPDEAYQFVVISVDRETGKLLWQKTAKEILPHEGHHKDHGFASSSPVTDGQHLYVSFGSRGLFCFDLAGNLKWEKDLGDMQTRNSFGEGSSPALHGNTLVINWDHEGEDFIVALDKNSGKELWRQKRDEPTNWSTPLIIKHDGVEQVIVSSTNRIRSYELSTGKVIWECGGMTTNVIPTPIADFGMVYALSGFRGAALLAIKLGGTGDLTDKPEAITWRHAKPRLMFHLRFFRESGCIFSPAIWAFSPALTQKRASPITRHSGSTNCWVAFTHLQWRRMEGSISSGVMEKR